MNILLYIIDALRADHLGCYGYGRNTSPVLDALAAEPGVVRFTHAFSPATWTKPVAASILSGCYPPAHGVRSRTDLFVRAVPRLPELLQAAGYRTAAVSTIGNVSSVLGFAAGFDDFADLYKDPELASRREVSNSGAWKLYFEEETTVVLPLAEDVHRRALDWLERTAAAARSETGRSSVTGRSDELAGAARSETGRSSATGRSDTGPLIYQSTNFPTPPWFLFLWALDTHDPYYPPEGYDRWRDPAYSGKIDGSAESVRRVRSEADVQRLRDLYDGEISYVDEQLGRLLDALRRSGQYDDTLLIVAGDHGEAFGEHGDFVHGHLAYEEVMHVPLLVKFPAALGIAGGAVDALAQLTDIAPTVLDVLGLGEQARAMQGVSLLPAVRDHAAPRTAAFSETQASPANQRLLAVRTERWKYLRVDPPGEYGGASATAAADAPAGLGRRLAGYAQQLANPEMVKRVLRNPMFYLRRQMAERRMLFDLAADPHERRNVAAEHPAVLAELDAALEAWLAECRGYAQLSDTHSATGLDAATLAQLHGLGYL